MTFWTAIPRCRLPRRPTPRTGWIWSKSTPFSGSSPWRGIAGSPSLEPLAGSVYAIGGTEWGKWLFRVLRRFRNSDREGNVTLAQNHDSTPALSLHLLLRALEGRSYWQTVRLRSKLIFFVLQRLTVWEAERGVQA